MVTLRAAQASDDAKIKWMVRTSKINPTGLKWPRFTVAENEAGELIGCVQLKPRSGDVCELASLVVAKPYRKQGIGGQLINHVIAMHDRELYLMCRPEMKRY